ncbi:cyanophycinase [Armatimonadetes bacterium GBS]|jgi:cyanophycinase|nr:cyanophycinase [Armatimonadetes bacterium GBS]CUU37191.1 cyanophycinase [Armatimonadetes bacterium GXS]
MPEGAVILAGGGETPPEIPRTIARLAQGAPIVVLAHTQQAIGEGAERSAEFLRQHGAQQVYAPDTADPEALLPLLKEARAVWIPGGDQNRFMERLGSHKSLIQAIREVYARGGVVGGTSAGASLMGALMPTGEQSSEKPLTKGGCTLAPALGLLPNAIVDQHFLKRHRLLRLLCALMENPTLIGIGVDENGWALVQNRTLKVQAGQVVVAQVQGKTRQHKELLGAEAIRLQVLLPGERRRLP